jgi:hypothetical protein
MLLPGQGVVDFLAHPFGIDRLRADYNDKMRRIIDCLLDFRREVLSGN